MRVLASTTANDGHFGPIAPFARACLEAGHEVLVASPASYAPTVTAHGFRHSPFPDVPLRVSRPIFARLPDLGFDEANLVVLKEIFAGLGVDYALPALIPLIEEWRPDVVLRELAEFGSLAASVRAGVPHIQVAAGMSETTTWAVGHTHDEVGELAQSAGVDPDDLRSALQREPLLTVVPESLDLVPGSGPPHRGATWRHSNPALTATAGPLPSDWGDPADPLVYWTFGSVLGRISHFGDVFPRFLAELADLPIRILLTVGRDFDLTALGTVPPNTRVEPWWPQADILARADLMIGHGGFGTTMGAVAAGVPQIVVPMFTSDQVINAAHVAARGSGVRVDGGPDAARATAGAVDRVLADARVRAAALELADEATAMPAMAAAVRIIEAIAAGGEGAAPPR